MVKIKLFKNFVCISAEFIKNIPPKVVLFAKDMDRSLQHSYLAREIYFIYEVAKIAESQKTEDISIAVRKIGIRTARFCSNKEDLVRYISGLLKSVHSLSDDTASPFSSFAERQHVQYTINFLEKLKENGKMMDEITYYLTLPKDLLKKLDEIENKDAEVPYVFPAG